MPATKPYPGTQSVLRAISLLKAFTDEHPEWKLTDLAHEVALNKATAFRLLTALESEAMVIRDAGSDRYRLGPAVMALGGRAMRANTLRVVSRPELEVLASQTHETVALEVLHGAEVLVLDEVISSYVMAGIQTIGSRWPAYATSTGKSILAFLPAEEVNALLPASLAPCTPNTIPTRAELHQDLALVRQRGYAIADEELEVGLLAIGAPLRNYEGRVVAAIGLAVPKRRLPEAEVAEMGELVSEVAQRISARLGFQADGASASGGTL